MSDSDADIIRQARQESIGRLLMRASRAFNIYATEKLHARGHVGLSTTHTLVMANLDLEGTRVSVLAQRLGVTKQAAGQLVADLEARDYVIKTVDPGDKRAALVSIQQRGWQFLRDAADIKAEFENECAAILGDQNTDILRQLLKQFLEHEDRFVSVLSE